jgi:hypothetical protein
MRKMLLTAFGALLFAGGVAAPASARIHISIPIEIVATTTPVYYEGHAAYWYGDRWYYRDRGEWYEYRDEPVYLRTWRDRHRHERLYYGRAHDRYEREEWREERHREERREESRERVRERERERERERRHDRDRD